MSEDGAGLERMPAALVEAEVLGQAMRGARECGFDVPVLHHPMRDQIVRAVEPRPGRAALKTRTWIGDGGEGFELERYQRGGIFGGLPALGHDQRDRLTHVAYLVARERVGINMKADRRQRQSERNAIAGKDRPQLPMSQDRADARQCARLRRVDASDAAMGDRASDEGRVQKPGQIEVVDEASCAAQQLGIFEARD